jgi:hypothetical protein
MLKAVSRLSSFYLKQGISSAKLNKFQSSITVFTTIGKSSSRPQIGEDVAVESADNITLPRDDHT